MNAGRELDTLVAVKVMGWSKTTELWNRGLTESVLAGLHPESKLPEKVPFYSTDISAAWRVVDFLRSKKMLLDIQEGENNDGPFFQVEINQFNVSKSRGGYWDTVVDSTDGDSIPHAICLAALRSVGIEF